MSKENRGCFQWSERQRLLSHRTLQPLMSTFQRLAGKIFEIFLYRDQFFFSSSPEANRAAVELLLGPKNPLVAQVISLFTS